MEDEYVEPLNYAHVCPVLFTVSYNDSRGEKFKIEQNRLVLCKIIFRGRISHRSR